MQQIGLLVGWKPKGKPRGDSLENFPNDVDYFGEEQIRNHLKYWKRILSKNNNVKDIGRIWDDRRASACRGEMGQAARRCSMDDRLWMMYINSVKVGTEPDMGLVKHWFSIQYYSSKAKTHPDKEERDKAFATLRALIRR